MTPADVTAYCESQHHFSEVPVAAQSLLQRAHGVFGPRGRTAENRQLHETN